MLAGHHLRWCLVILAYVVLQPPETGLGIELCPVSRFTHAPCPGCGLTRSGANMIRGRFQRAADFNPFGYVFMPMILGLGLFSLLPPIFRAATERRLRPAARGLRLGYLALIGCFLGFGLIRWAAVMAGLLAFPPSLP
jgi:hypothetical protein